MKYYLFVGENCHDCKKVCKTIVEMRLDIPVKNIDKGVQPPMDLFILPALVTPEGNLKAYGLDIVDYLKNPINNAPQMSFIKRIMQIIKDYC